MKSWANNLNLFKQDKGTPLMVVGTKEPTAFRPSVCGVHTYEGRCCFITILIIMNSNKNLQQTLFTSEQLVSIQNGKVMTSSLQVANVFGKQHKDVLRAINQLECSQPFKERNFAPSFYIRELDNRGQHKYPMYYMTKDGFTFLVMGFTGKVAAKFKEDYINAFNSMEKYIRDISDKDMENTMLLKETFERKYKTLRSSNRWWQKTCLDLTSLLKSAYCPVLT